MPTGYTADLTPDSSFREFALRCARAFGAAIHLRDEDTGPELTLPTLNTYHKDALAKAEARAAELVDFPLVLAEGRAKQQNEERAKGYQNSLAEFYTLKKAYQNMLLRLADWQPPTPQHRKLQEFMREQLTSSMDFDCHEPGMPPVIDGESWLACERRINERDLEYHAEHWAKDQQRHAENVEWITALKNSLPTA